MWDKMLIIGLGGFIGANARYLLGGWVQQRWGSSFPMGTFLINVIGSFILGFFMPVALSLGWSEKWRLFIAMGLVGAFTTFSTFEYETLNLMVRKEYLAAILNVFGSLVVAFLAAWGGLVLARLIGHGKI
jgi:fluoride exporter